MKRSITAAALMFMLGCDDPAPECRAAADRLRRGQEAEDFADVFGGSSPEQGVERLGLVLTGMVVVVQFCEADELSCEQFSAGEVFDPSMTSEIDATMDQLIDCLDPE